MAEIERRRPPDAHQRHPHKPDGSGARDWARPVARFLSSAAFGRIGDDYVKAVYRFAEAHHIPVVHFKKGENKEEVARPYLEAAAHERKDRVVLIGIVQEKASVWRSWPRKGQEKARHPHMDWGREMAYINHFYFYLWDSEWGGAFWKTNAYAPYPVFTFGDAMHVFEDPYALFEQDRTDEARELRWQ